MWKYAIHVAYLGTDFFGWQRQKVEGPKSLTVPDPSEGIQRLLEHALSEITGESPSVVGSGRTDSGVHSVGQVAHFVLRKKEWDPSKLASGLNSKLDYKVRVVTCKQVPIEFHAQRSAIKKQYSYYLQQGPCALPHCYPISWWIRKDLNISSMQKALKPMVGEHDFGAFQSKGAKPGPTTRKIFEASVSKVKLDFPEVRDFSLIRVKVIGSGFLKQMVRSIVGTLVKVGEEKVEDTLFSQILGASPKSKARSMVGPTAPSRGLWLENVWYF